ncbi:MAG TPA: SGNH/GDSL hydrolase family protein [Nocardioides sp.]|uniref:SGNH/GDSL hydrolase family protein n=1 Tax=Nocardioides sp. TaxID=35761 RepID=UPI002ED9AEAC
MLAAVVGVVVRGTASADDVARCERHQDAAAARARLVTGSGARTVVIGDSWSVGFRLDRPAAAWPARLPGRISVDGFSGSGFSATASPCPGVSFAERASRAVAGGAELVIVEGGLNDYDQPERSVRDGFAALMSRLSPYVADRAVVVVGPPPAPARSRGAQRVDRWLGQLCEEYGVAYVSSAGLDLEYLPDRLHLTAAGHRAFGDWVADQLPR